MYSVHFLYRSVAADDLYYWSLSPESGSSNVYPGYFEIRFNRPVVVNPNPEGVYFRHVGAYPDVRLSTGVLTTSGDTFYFDTNNPSNNGELLISGSQYAVRIDQLDVLAENSADYYEASGNYWSGFYNYDWVITFVDLFAGKTQYATPTPSTVIDFGSFATTVRTSYSGISSAVIGNGVSNVELRACGTNTLLGSVGVDRPTSVSGNEARLTISQAVLQSVLGTYDASVSGAQRCVTLALPAGYVRHPTYYLGSTARSMQYTLKYLVHERLTANNEIVQPDQVFSVDYNQQIELVATTTVARLYDVEAASFVASIPMTTGVNAYVGDGDVADGMTGDTLYLDFGNAYSLVAGKTYRIDIPGNAVRVLNSWDFARYNIDGSEYSFTVANDADAPQVVSYSPSGIDVATTTSDVVVVYDEPITLSSNTTTFDVWTSTEATSTVSSVANAYESVSDDEYTIDLQAVLNAAFGSSELEEGETYWIRISSNAVLDDEENEMDTPYILHFTTVSAEVDEPSEPEPEPEPEVEESQNSSSRSSGRRSRGGAASAGGTGTTGGIVHVDSLGQLTDPVSGNIGFGDAGVMVYRLQQALNRIGFYVATEGPGSPGMETEVFATSTRNALVRFQLNANITPALGYFGPITRALLGYILNW